MGRGGIAAQGPSKGAAFFPRARLPLRASRNVACYCPTLYAVFDFDAKNPMTNVPAFVMAVETPDYRRGMPTSAQVGIRDAAPVAISGYAGKRGHAVAMSSEIAELGTWRLSDRKAPDILYRYRIAGAGGSARLKRDLTWRDAVCDGIVPFIPATFAVPRIALGWRRNQDIDDPALYRELPAREDARV